MNPTFTKKITLAILVIVMTSVVVLTVPRTVRAAGLYFGGMHTVSLTCTCSGNTLMYINNYAGGSLALIYDGSGRLYANNNIYGTYLLGSYSPGGQCQMIAYPDCITIQSDGKFDSNPGTGTS